MPYISLERREWLTPRADGMAASSGELNFQITMVLRAYLENHGLNYAVINDIVGACDGAKAEFQRRIADPYEDQAIKRNGDVY